MSNIYIQEPPALGKVLLKTSAGDIDIELWTKEAPKACRNFIQLCLEGYYNGTIFHRVVPEFIVQGGDPNGDGTGGESIYGEPFKDEFHSRLRFNRRGLVAMANAGRDDNGSQFFFTLAATPELQNKHTIFGKVTGETIYNVLKLAEGLVGPDDRPEHPQRVAGADVLINPFTDIEPRAVPKAAVVEVVKRKREVKAVKNFALLSFGDEACDEEAGARAYSGRPKSSHDLLHDPALGTLTAAELELQQAKEEEEKETEEDIKKTAETAAAVSSIRNKLKGKRQRSPDDDGRKKRKEESEEEAKKSEEEAKKSEEEAKKSEEEGEYYLGKDRDIARGKERDRIREEIKQLKREMKAPKDKPIEAEKPEEDPKPKIDDNQMYKEFVDEQEKYKKIKDAIPKKGAAREDFTLQLLAKFKNKLSAIKEKASAEPQADKDTEDDDVSTDDWLGHRLRFDESRPVLARDASSKSDDWFDIYDPRNPINKRKRGEGDKGKGQKGGRK